MQQFTLSFVLSALSSERVKSSIASAAFFGAAGALRGAAARFESFTRTIRNIEGKYPERAEKMRTSVTFIDLEKKMEAAANKAAAIHALAEQAGVMLRVEFEPPIAKPLTKVEVDNLAALTNLKPELITKVREDADKRRYDAEMEAADLAASLFWSAVADADAPITFDSVSRSIERTRLNILTWSRPDLAELALIASDELALNDWMQTMCDDVTQFTQDDEEEVAARQRKAEVQALDAHAKQQQAIAYLDEERKKAANKPRRTRVKKDAQGAVA